MCTCEHATHFEGGSGHEYRAVPAGMQTMNLVGLVCDPCAAEHQPDREQIDEFLGRLGFL